MSVFKTPLTNLLKITTPIVVPPMAGSSGGALAAHATLGGAFGFIAVGYDHPDKFAEQLTLARSILAHPVSNPAPLPIGVGVLAWQLHPPVSGSPSPEPNALLSLRMALANRVKAIWLAFGPDIGAWVRFVREHDQNAANGHKTLVFVLVNSVQEALQAANEWKVDAIVAQGIESGGHGSASAPPLHILLPSILSSLFPRANANTPSPIPVIAAGGISTGTQIASILALGASGAALGTRFLLSPEALFPSPFTSPDGQARTKAQNQALLLAASVEDTVRSMAFDRARGTPLATVTGEFGWPQGVDGRGLANLSVRDALMGATDVQLKERYDTTTSDTPHVEEETAGGGTHVLPGLGRRLVWSGMGIGLVKEIKPAQDIVRELHADTAESLGAISRLLDTTA